MKDDNPNMSLAQRQKISRTMKKIHAAKRKGKKKATKRTRSIKLEQVSDEAKPLVAKARKKYTKRAVSNGIDADVKLELLKLLNKIFN
jgi:DNA invertase Pin-like site-specific DNA recombinase